VERLDWKIRSGKPGRKGISGGSAQERKPITGFTHQEKPRFSLLLACLFLSASLMLQSRTNAQQLTAQASEFHSIDSIRALSLDEASLGHAVSLRGVVTLAMEGGLVVHDAREGIWITWSKFKDFQPGDEVEVAGKVGAGRFAPMVRASLVRKIGALPLPKPVPVTFDQLSSGDYDAQYVTVTGSIRSVGKRPVGQNDVSRQPKHLIIRIESGNGMLMARLPGDAEECLHDMLDGMVRITATVTGSKNSNRQLIAPILAIASLEDVVLLHPPSAEPWSAPLLPIGRLMQWRSGTDVDHRVHIAGTVTYYRPGESLVVEDGGVALYARTDQSKDLSLGDKVEVLGFPAPRETGPILENAVVRRIASGPPLAPARVRLADLSSGKLSYNLVSTEGVLVQQLSSPSQRILLLRDGANFVEAEMDGDTESMLRSIRDGSTVRVAGINALRVKRAWNYDVDGTEKLHCRILLRSGSDVSLVELPTWWTVPHAIYVAAGLAALALLFLIQMIRNHFERSRLQAVLAERERLAHDLHDTLAQSFAGIGYQLQAIRREIPGNPRKLEQQVDLARDLVRHSHKEARRTLASYSTEAEGQSDLLERLEASARKTAEGGEVEIRTLLTGEPRPLRPAAATALFRIGQEAIANAMRHADPKHLTIAVSYATASVTLSVTDDGCGFVESGDLLGFGLRGMRKRAAAVGATFEVSSTPGTGTRVAVMVPHLSAFKRSGFRHSVRYHLWERLIHAQSEE
jgi:signal transduction histidine kinase